MAKKTKTLDLVAKLGTKGKKAFNAHRGDETTFNTGGNLPEGIEGGIAQLVECKFDSYSKGDMVGEPYFIASGVVVEPEEHEGRKVVGLRTMIMEPLCDTSRRTRQDVDDHMEWVLNQLRMLGVDTEGIDYSDVQDVVAALKEDGPYFRFRTWKGEATEDFPNPRVNHQWDGVVEYEAGEDNQVDDKSAPKQRKSAKSKAAEDDGPSHEEELDLSELGELADADDEEAQAKLTELAEAQGFDVETVEAWSDVAVALAENGAPAEEGEGEGEEAAAPPEKDDVFYYRPPRKRKRIECLVTAVFAGKETCNLKNLDDDKVYKGIAWTDIYEEKE